MIRIYYSDGTVWEGEGKPPSRDVQVILQDNSTVGYYLQTACDYYVKRGERWLGVDIFGLFDYLLDSGIVLFGRTIDNEEYRQIVLRANIEMGEKQNWLQSERKP